MNRNVLKITFILINCAALNFSFCFGESLSTLDRESIQKLIADSKPNFELVLARTMNSSEDDAIINEIVKTNDITDIRKRKYTSGTNQTLNASSKFKGEDLTYDIGKNEICTTMNILSYQYCLSVNTNDVYRKGLHERPDLVYSANLGGQASVDKLINLKARIYKELGAYHNAEWEPQNYKIYLDNNKTSPDDIDGLFCFVTYLIERAKLHFTYNTKTDNIIYYEDQGFEIYKSLIETNVSRGDFTNAMDLHNVLNIKDPNAIVKEYKDKIAFKVQYGDDTQMQIDFFNKYIDLNIDRLAYISNNQHLSATSDVRRELAYAYLVLAMAHDKLGDKQMAALYANKLVDINSTPVDTTTYLLSNVGYKYKFDYTPTSTFALMFRASLLTKYGKRKEALNDYKLACKYRNKEACEKINYKMRK